MHVTLAIVLGFQNPSRLAISRCKGLVTFFSDLKNDIGSTNLRLNHFALQVPSDLPSGFSDKAYEASWKCLLKLTNMVSLESLHLTWKSDSLFSDYLPGIEGATPKPTKLVTLSIHAGENDLDIEGIDLSMSIDWLRATLIKHPRLQPLGWKGNENYILQEPLDSYDINLELMICVPSVSTI
jgi:hypothetical protein